jgi:hypothetical protein
MAARRTKATTRGAALSITAALEKQGVMPNDQGKSMSSLHSRFDETEVDENGMLQPGKLAARTAISKR